MFSQAEGGAIKAKIHLALMRLGLILPHSPPELWGGAYRMRFIYRWSLACGLSHAPEAMQGGQCLPSTWNSGIAQCVF